MNCTRFKYPFDYNILSGIALEYSGAFFNNRPAVFYFRIPALYIFGIFKAAFPIPMSCIFPLNPILAPGYPAIPYTGYLLSYRALPIHSICRAYARQIDHHLMNSKPLTAVTTLATIVLILTIFIFYFLFGMNIPVLKGLCSDPSFVSVVINLFFVT